MREAIIDFFNFFVIFYSGFLVLSYIWMVILALRKHRLHVIYHNEKNTIEELRHSPYATGISIVAPAYNEERTIIDNVHSLLSLDYPDYEVIIVNDGSKDRTLELLIEQFDLEKVPYAYIEKIKTKPFRALYKTRSDNPVFKRLTVVDKVNGGTKADASNAGVSDESLFRVYGCGLYLGQGSLVPHYLADDEYRYPRDRRKCDDADVQWLQGGERTDARSPSTA